VKPDQYLFDSERLGFRLMHMADFDHLVALDGDPEVRSHFPDGVATSDECRERIVRNRALFDKRGFSDFAVIHKTDGEFAGRAGFGLLPQDEIEVGYVFLKPFWGRGLAQETLKALLGWAESHIKAERIIAYAPSSHSASINVMKKGGMRYFKTETARSVECVFYEYRFRK